jgi:hypothetical protein
VEEVESVTGTYSHEDAAIDAIRDQWLMREHLLCYSLKLDGRISCYIIINDELGYRFSVALFTRHN